MALLNELNTGNRPDIEASLGKALNIRALALNRAGEVELALKDLDKASTIIDKLAEKQIIPHLVAIRAQTASTYGKIATEIAESNVSDPKGVLVKAESHYSLAIGLLQKLKVEAPKAMQIEGLATTLQGRSLVRFRLGDMSGSLADAQESHELYQKLVDGEIRPHMERGLAEISVNLVLFNAKLTNRRMAYQLSPKALNCSASLPRAATVTMKFNSPEPFRYAVASTQNQTISPRR